MVASCLLADLDVGELALLLAVLAAGAVGVGVAEAGDGGGQGEGEESLELHDEGFLCFLVV